MNQIAFANAVMLTPDRSEKQRIWSLTKLRILAIGLATITLATGISSETAIAQNPPRLTKAATELPIVKSAALGTNMNVPWSQPVRIVDPFEGDYLGIFDRNYFYRRFLNTNARVEVVSLWSRDSIRFLLAYRDRNCLSTHSFYPSPFRASCAVANTTLNVTNLWLKVDNQVFRLAGTNSTFPVSQELATALKNSLPENVEIRLVAESGEAIDSEVGKGTVQAWKAIY